MNAATREKYDVFVGNLPQNISDEQLKVLRACLRSPAIISLVIMLLYNVSRMQDEFSIVGAVKTVRIQKDRESGRSKGFAFVEFFDPMTALSAIRNLNGTVFQGKQVRV